MTESPYSDSQIGGRNHVLAMQMFNQQLISRSKFLEQMIHGTEPFRREYKMEETDRCPLCRAKAVRVDTLELFTHEKHAEYGTMPQREVKRVIEYACGTRYRPDDELDRVSVGEHCIK